MRFPFFLFFPVMILLLTAIVMVLWNAILPDIVHVEKINYWQSLGLLALCRILFGGFRFGGRGRHFQGGAPHMRQRWMSMSEEERVKFKEEWKKRCEQRKP